jgi:hypothetical protein
MRDAVLTTLLVSSFLLGSPSLVLGREKLLAIPLKSASLN